MVKQPSRREALVFTSVVVGSVAFDAGLHSGISVPYFSEGKPKDPFGREQPLPKELNRDLSLFLGYVHKYLNVFKDKDIWGNFFDYLKTAPVEDISNHFRTSTYEDVYRNEDGLFYTPKIYDLAWPEQNMINGVHANTLLFERQVAVSINPYQQYKADMFFFGFQGSDKKLTTLTDNDPRRERSNNGKPEYTNITPLQMAQMGMSFTNNPYYSHTRGSDWEEYEKYVGNDGRDRVWNVRKYSFSQGKMLSEVIANEVGGVRLYVHEGSF